MRKLKTPWRFIFSTRKTCCKLLGFKALLLVCVGLVAGHSPLLRAQDQGGGDPVYGVFSLNASAEREVANDLMIVTLMAQAQGSDSAEIANTVNASMGWATARLRAYNNIKVQTRDYQTHPRYERNGSRIIGWNASQSLLLETDNFEEAGKAIQTLQERLQVKGIRLTTKPETRKKAQDELMNEALDAFKQRALLVQLNMGSQGYRIMNVHVINDNGGNFNYNTPQMRMAETAASAAPAIEAGTSRVEVRVDGRIQLE